MDTLKLTIEEFCWYYSAGCLKDSLEKGFITKQDFTTAMGYRRDQIIPKPREVRAWSPRPFRELEKNGKPCTLEMMQKYWRYLHRGEFGKIEESPTYVAKIITIDETRIHAREETQYSLIKLPGDSRILIAENFRKLSLEPGDLVNIHGDVIAELTPLEFLI
jgi:hypothetical protein